MVSKKNFVQNRQMPYKKPAGVRSSVRQFNQFNQICQIPDMGYVDFNAVPPMNFNQPQNSVAQSPKKKNIKNKQKNKPNAQQQQSQQPQQNQQNAWRKNKNMQQQQRGPNQKFNNQQRGFPPGPMNMRGGMGGNRMMPRRMPTNFQRPPMMPPIPPHMGPMRPPMNMPPMNMPQAPPSFMRRSGRRPGNMDGNFNKKQMFSRPPMNMPPMNMPPMMPAMMAGPPRMPMPFNAMGPSPGKVKKPNAKVVKKIVKGKSTIKTLKNLQNQYPLDKPWVTDDIRAEHGKKIEIENQLKGKKDDELFAKFKEQRDKFVSLYETAREEYLKKEAAQVKTKDANGKQSNNKNTAKNGKNNDKNSNTNANSNENTNSNANAKTNA